MYTVGQFKWHFSSSNMWQVNQHSSCCINRQMQAAAAGTVSDKAVVKYWLRTLDQ
jgi:hypothetical protein